MTGFMGCGKTTIGSRLAGLLSYRFIDLDREIEAYTGKPVPQVFAERGEAGFRRIEKELFERTLSMERTVVSVGGGALVNESSLEQALASGLVVYLRVDTEELVMRLFKSSTPRPLLQDGHRNLLSYARLSEKIHNLVALREPYYKKAHLEIDGTGLAIEQTLGRLYSAIEPFNRKTGRPVPPATAGTSGDETA